MTAYGQVYTRREYSSLATASARQCSTCYGRDGTIVSRSINREKNVIFKKTWFDWKKVNKKNTYHISSIKSENQEVSGRFTLSLCKTAARKCTKKCAAVRPIVFFHSSGQGHPTTVFCKISVRRCKFCLEFSFTWQKISRWPFHSCTIFEAHQIMLINSLGFSEV